MKTLIATLALCLASMASPARADEGGACHFHGSKPAMAETVSGCATQRKDALIARGKIDKSWQGVKHDKAEIVEGAKGKEWKVTFKDAAAQDKSKETLYMFFTLPGNFVAANFTGK
jgi:hypothetical protein